MDPMSYQNPSDPHPFSQPYWPQPDPAASAGYPPPSPAAPGPAAPSRPRRPGMALAAVALAVGVVAGGVGGFVGAALGSGGALPVSVSSGGLTVSDSAVESASMKEGTVESAAATIGPTVVTISVSSGRSGQGSFGQQADQVSGTGSGVVIRSDGYIVTNNHVVAEATSGGSVSVEFSDGSRAPASIVGTDPSSDLAVVKVDKSGLKAAVFADSDALNVGQAVIAVGAPLGLSNTVTEGIVSTLHRPVTTGEADASALTVIDAVQTDAAINPGNSGGALSDMAGRLVGINSAIATVGGSGGQSGNIGVGFAIPANDVARVAGELIETGKASHAQLGVSVADSRASSASGATLSQVTPGGAAAEAGLEVGDVVVKVDGRPVDGAESLIAAVRSHAPGTSVTVTYVRDGSTQTTKATLDSAS